MRILVAVNRELYSKYVVRQVAKLARNTWANVTLLGIGNQAPPEGQSVDTLLDSDESVSELADRLHSYGQQFCDCFEDADLLYGPHASEYHLVREEKGGLSLDYPGKAGRKVLDLRIRFGNTGKEILAESAEVGADLIVVGCHPEQGSSWPSDRDIPQKVVENASCSVLVIKEEKQPQMLVCCLDHDTVSQPSIELINQLVTFYNAELEIIGVMDANGLRADVDRRMSRILSYYTSRHIKAWVKLVDGHSLNNFIAQAAEKNLVAVWTSKQSFLAKIFSKQHLGDLATTAQSSVLILR
jgi:nucleotide-binding universal stress UspA family protein